MVTHALYRHHLVLGGDPRHGDGGGSQVGQLGADLIHLQQQAGSPGGSLLQTSVQLEKLEELHTTNNR